MIFLAKTQAKILSIELGPRKGNAAAARQRDRMSQLSGKGVQIRRPMSQVVIKVENVVI